MLNEGLYRALEPTFW